ncbi:hypothetical protein [Scopulibacillus cellulosilyticus]|uniref:Uncharacterized protein n=1 Tax=Scopulibacillus cellulosilyticus TaxID=2665665 RepID=A0ABW2Q3P7_9BACL
MNRQEMAIRVRNIAEAIVYEKGYVSAVDLFIRMDKLSVKDHEKWRKRQVPYLERGIMGNLKQLSYIMKELRSYAQNRGLKPSWTYYYSWGKGPKVKLQFSKYGDPSVEKIYATHFVDAKRLNKQ